jgi:hypothetical protein
MDGTKPVRVGFQVEDRIALRTDVALTERIGRIAADGDELMVLVLELEATDGFAQGTGAVA